MKIATIAQIHPISQRLIDQGHPWITADVYSQNFPVQADLLSWKKSLFIHDPQHKKIKARLWLKDNKNKTYDKQHFLHDLRTRLSQAIEKRIQSPYFNKRTHCYFVFAESDHLPGIQIRRLGSTILLETYASFWVQHWTTISEHICNELLQKHQWEKISIWGVPRSRDYAGQKQVKITKLYSNENYPTQLDVEENQILYQVFIGQSYDYGIYTDMAAIRERMPWPNSGSKALNLYSYTGAFTLELLKKGCHVTSIDSSAALMEKLNNNIQRNISEGRIPTNSDQRHQALVTDVLQYLRDNQSFDHQLTKFDFIICDPPTSFTHKTKKKSQGSRVQTHQTYPQFIPNLLKLLNPGGKLVIFSNHHGTKREKWRQLILKSLTEFQKHHKVKVIQELSMQDDCHISSQFPEGDYLKGIVLKLC